jgi:tetratricopeptide (TPR) repeat protein
LVGEKKAPTEAIELGTPRTETVMSVITLPGGYSANLPEAMHVATPFARFDRTYQLITDGASQKVQTTRTLTILTAKLEVSQWPAYKKFLTDSVEQNEPWIQLYAVGRGAASGTAAAATPSSGNGSGSSSADVAPGQSGLAAELMRQAYTMLQQKDLDGARKNLDEVRALNPHQEGLWALYGFLAAQSEPKDMDEWVADMKKEIAEHPDEVRFYMALAQYYISSKHEDEGFATLRSALAHNPKETATALYLASLLNARGDYAGAEPVLRAAMAEVPANGEIKIQLGTTLMHEGHFDDGEALLRDVLANTNDAGQLNDAAYELADGGFDLPLAEKASRRSLELLDEETHDGETGTNALQRANLLLASWDTLGWILYREDKEPEAMPWIRAAWQNGLATEPGYHYGVLLEREHRQAEALKIYTLASGGRNGENQSAIQKLLKNRIAGLQSAGVKTEVENASTELQRIRSYHLKDAPPATPGDKGWAVFEFAISNDAPMLVSFISGDEALQGFTTSLAKLDLQLDMPKASHALLLRRGVLSCHTGCDLVLVQPDSIGSAQ